jgi:predicted  nucleic acid-binding Zn-ribbon protein
MGTEGADRERRAIESDLKATAERLAADAEKVKSIESVKARLPLDHPALPDLAERSKELATTMVRLANTETALVEQANMDGADPATGEA